KHRQRHTQIKRERVLGDATVVFGDVHGRSKRIFRSSASRERFWGCDIPVAWRSPSKGNFLE
ncbi:MAG: hypothetical protein ACI4P6_03845, partial [Candidatus Spyradosoma sp.]